MRQIGTPRWLPALAILAGCLLLAAGGVAVSASSTYVGSGKCKECHEELAKSFAANIHSKAAAYGVKDAGCESCHGPGSAHADSGDTSSIVNPAKLATEAATAKCLECHGDDKGRIYWNGSAHEGHGVGCAACHAIHAGRDRLLAKKSENEVCFGCHSDVRAALLKRSKHPMRDSSSPAGEGKMACSACHNAHGARGEKLIAAKSVNDKCFECHAEKKAPVLWEHSPVKEDCLTCHAAHGSNVDKMLVAKVPRLCQECHMQGRHQSGTLSTSSVYALNRSCLNCHPAIHGSNNPSGPVLQR